MINREWNLLALSFRDADVSMTTEKNCVLFSLFYRSFRCFQCLHVQKFNATLNERRDREFCSSSFERVAISFNRTLMTWHESFSAKLDCQNKFCKFCRAHSSFFRNDWSVFQRSWLIFRVHRDVWSLYQRFSNVFFYFNWSLSLRRWRFHFFHFRQNKFVIVNLNDLRCDFAIFLFYCFWWLFSKNSLMTLRCKIDFVSFSFFLNVCAFNVSLFIKKSFVTLTFFFFDIKFLLMRFIVVSMMLIERFTFMLTIEFYNNFFRWTFMRKTWVFIFNVFVAVVL